MRCYAPGPRVVHGSISCDPTQPNPWVNPTHGQLCRDPTGGAKSAPQTWLDFGERKGRKKWREFERQGKKRAGTGNGKEREVKRKSRGEKRRCKRREEEEG